MTERKLQIGIPLPDKVLDGEGITEVLACLIPHLFNHGLTGITIACFREHQRDIQAWCVERGLPMPKIRFLCSSNSVWLRMLLFLRQKYLCIRGKLQNALFYNTQGVLASAGSTFSQLMPVRFIPYAARVNPVLQRIIHKSIRLAAVFALLLPLYCLTLAFGGGPFWLLSGLFLGILLGAFFVRRKLRGWIIESESPVRNMRRLAETMRGDKPTDAWLLIHCGVFPPGAPLPEKSVGLLWDNVIADFPSSFIRHTKSWLRSSVFNGRDINRYCRAFITSSEYVRRWHAVEAMGIPLEKIHVVTYPPPEVKPALPFDSTLPRERGRELAAEYLRAFLARRQGGHDWNESCPWWFLAEMAWEDVPFIFSSTQNRPHKNIFRLVQAYEILLRRKHWKGKLVMTGWPPDNPDLAQLITSRCLGLDVLAVYRIPPDILACLYYLADLVVCSSPFEGGGGHGPFFEGHSLGTPAVLAAMDCGLYSERLGPAMFDPNDVRDMAEKIHWGLTHREALHELESLEIEEILQDISWDKTAKNFVKVFKQVAS